MLLIQISLHDQEAVCACITAYPYTTFGVELSFRKKVYPTIEDLCPSRRHLGESPPPGKNLELASGNDCK
jgi:hypothetical protein